MSRENSDNPEPATVHIFSRREALVAVEDDGLEVDAVFSLCFRPIEPTTHHLPIQDGMNDHNRFRNVVDTAVALLQEHEDVVIHCKAGRSRSVIVTATALAELNETTLGEELTNLKTELPQTNVAEPLIHHAKEYLDEGSLSEYYEEYGLDPDQFNAP